MLPAGARLRRASEFQAVYRQGRSYADSLVVLHVLADRPGPCQVGFAVGKKVGKAVIRNLARRRLRAAMNAHLGELPAGTWLVVGARSGAAAASYDQLVRSLAELLGRARLRSSVDKGERGS